MRGHKKKEEKGGFELRAQKAGGIHAANGGGSGRVWAGLWDGDLDDPRGVTGKSRLFSFECDPIAKK